MLFQRKTEHFLNHEFLEMGLFTMFRELLAFKVHSRSRLPMSELSGYHCIFTTHLVTDVNSYFL